MRRTNTRDPSMLHDNNHVSIMKVLPVMCAKDSSLVLKNTHDAVRKNVRSHVSIHCSQWIVKKINLFVLDREKNLTLQLKKTCVYSA